MPHTPHTSTINLLEANARAQTATSIITGFSRATPALTELWQQIQHSLSDVPILTEEITRLNSEFVTVRLQRANLAAAARVTLTAHRDGEPDPLFYLRDELSAQGFGGGLA